MHAAPNPEQLAIIESYKRQAPADGPFHRQEDLHLFLDTPPELYTPGPLVVARLCSLEHVATISGPFAVGKNAAKEAAVSQSVSRHPRHGVSIIHPVLNGTTRLPEFRDGQVEKHGREYDFAFTKSKNMRLSHLLRRGLLVQYAQPRGDRDHVYFTQLDSFPESGIALMDTVPDTLRDLNRILAHCGKTAIGIYRTVDTFDDWMSRIKGRGDIIDQHGDVIDNENYEKRMNEAVTSITKAMDVRHELGVKFFAAGERSEAGEAVVDILTGHHTKKMQKRGEKGAQKMLKGLAEHGFKSKD